jgi:putative ATPase
MRPRSLDEYIGQDHIVGPGRLLRRAIQADQLSSVIFYGPPGTGKTTLARVIANHTKSNFVTLNAVLAGVQQIRESIAAADEQRRLYGRRTILFVDEVHRWNRAQQDALLPWVENGTIILIGATTENPFFEVNKALVSRSRVFQLKALTRDDLMAAARAALADAERGYGRWKVEFAPGALEHLVDTAGGDARSLLNALELAVESAVPAWPPVEGTRIEIDLKAAEESIQQKVVLYDRDGDYHYDVISAFIKSLRGRDPDAALYWLARMVAAGEDPHFIFRRMLISACEDTGLADPYAISVVESSAAAFDRVGLPEGRYHLAHAALYLATSPKSNSSMAFFDALAAVEREDAEVPNHLRDASRDAEGFGHGQGYIYPHTYREHWAAQQYLPDPLVGRVFYSPSTQGYEGTIRDGVLTRRELQISAILDDSGLAGAEGAAGEQSPDGGNPEGAYDRIYFGLEGKKRSFRAPRGELLTFSPGATKRDEWTKRLDSGRSETLLAIRNRLTELAGILRHHRVLVWGADDGLLIWEAGRLAPEGFAAGLCRSERAKAILDQYGATLDAIDRPALAVMESAAAVNATEATAETPRAAPEAAPALDDPLSVPFDRVLARDPGATEDALLGFVDAALTRCAQGGMVAFSARVPCRGMRLSSLLPEGDPLRDTASAIEEKLYRDQSIPLFAWDEKTLLARLEKRGLSAKIETRRFAEPRRVTKDDLARWFDSAESPYALALAEGLDAESLAAFRSSLEAVIRRAPVLWNQEILFCTVNARDSGI